MHNKTRDEEKSVVVLLFQASSFCLLDNVYDQLWGSGLRLLVYIAWKLA
jgi:hypothetical protein